MLKACVLVGMVLLCCLIMIIAIETIKILFYVLKTSHN